MLRSFRLPLAIVLIGSAGQSFAADAYRSHPPMRALPAAANRALGQGPAWFVAPQGNDRHAGDKQQPWRTLEHAVRQLKPGDTLYLRGGTYYESVIVAVFGTAEQPITIRGYPGELAIIDAGLREFHDDPSTAWEPFAGGAPAEYRSTKSYTCGGGFGNFADSMVPFHRYLHLTDLRSSNEFWVAGLNDRRDDPKGLYCGPGAYRDPVTGHIHVRLAHTQLAGLGQSAYRGETDPRKLPLIVAGRDYALRIEGSRHLRLQDLVVRGAQRAAIEISEHAEDTLRDAEAIELSGLTLYGSHSALQTRRVRGLAVTNCALHGHSAPWHSRAHHKYRALAGYLVKAVGKDFEFSNCNFTDHHDFMHCHGVDGLRFHHNLVDNFNDDGVEVGPKKEKGRMLIYQNLISRVLLPFSLHGTVGEKPQPVPSEAGSGVFIYRNIFDGRQGTYKSPPQEADPSGAYLNLATQGITCDHASPTWPAYHIYHNTFLLQEPKDGSYGFRCSAGMRESQRRLFNNVFFQFDQPPSFRAFPTAEDDFQADGNLHWGTHGASQTEAGLFDKFRRSPLLEASKKHYPPGWFAHDVLADPRFQTLEGRADLRLQKGSPAIDAGVELSADWPDPLRQQDQGKPDIGALPLGAAPFQAGKL